MASLDGISFDVTTRQVSRTILSSVGGFSQSARQHIRSLQDLLATIQRFDLDVFDSRLLRRDGFIGEGVSYKVSRCLHTQSNKLYAIKTVKLPAQDADSGAFQRQVACVLRDIEVMYGLAKRPNILDIHGYGWDVESGNVIPFLVTEFAAEGTLRHFLRNNELSIHEKLLLCKDIAQGLHSLHVAGIAHGDLKLDNVLVTPSLGVGYSFMEHELRTTGMEACISDFGHSLHLYDSEGDTAVKQRYGGTLAYNAPEILDRQRSAMEDISFRRCDIWSLGLACWEVLIDGAAYYHNSDVEESIMSSQKQRSNSLLTPPPSNAPSQASSAAMIEELANIAPQLAQISCKEISDKVGSGLTPRELGRLHFLFRRCLEPLPANRLIDIPLLPFFHGQKTVEPVALVPSRIGVGTGTSWSFELFRVADMIPNEVRKQIASDCQKIANEPGQSILTARASFQLGLAYATGFGVLPEPDEAVSWFEKSADKGFRLAKLYLPVLRSLADTEESSSHEICLSRYLDGTRTAFKAKFASTLLDVPDDGSEVTEAELERLVEDNLSERSDIDCLDEGGNTCLTLVSKLGLADVTQSLLDGGGGATLEDTEGCTPLHWLFTYPTGAVRSLAHQLTSERDKFVFLGELEDKIHVPSSLDHLAPFDRPQNLDPQLPLRLIGTPLAFAVAVHCISAVEALLELGADPLLGQYNFGHEIQLSSAICIAYRLHMADLLDIILRHMRVSGTGAPVLIRILNGLQQYMPMPEVERALIHGMSHLQLAAQETISVLRKYYRYAAYEPRTFDFLKPAAMNCNPDLCQAIINVFEQESFYHELMPTESDELMYICISVACESGIESVSAFKMLDLATSIGCNINCYSETGRTPLFVIIDRQRPELLDWILENPRLDLAARDQAGNTALHLLITSGLSATYDMQKLLSKGVDPNWVNTEGERPLGIAQANRKFEEFKTLLSVTKLTLDERRQLIYSAVKADAPKLVSANLQEYKSHYGSQTDVAMLDHALTLATEFSGGEVGEILFQSGADPTRKTDNGTATIHESAEQGNIDILNLCLKAAHHVDQENGVGTPLLIATSVLVRDDHRQLGARACADALLDAGANPSPADSDSRTPLAFLLQADKRVRTKHTSLIKILLEKGADPNEGRLSPFIEYPLSKAIKEEDFDLADLLVEHNISLDRQGKDGNYPLHALASISTNLTIDQTNESRPAKLAARLLQNGADPLSVNTRGTTPLEDAVLSANGPLTLAILQHLATPADIAEGSFQRTFGQETGTGTKIFGMRLRKSKKDKEHTTYKLQPVPRRISNIQQSWGLAVFWESSASMCAFLRAGVNGPTSFLTRRLAILLLRYAMQNAIDDVLAMFMGGLNDNMEPDNYLKAVWDSVRDFFPWGADHAQLQSYPFLYKYRRDGRLDGSRFAHLLEADDDMPSNMMPYYYRLQYCNAIDRYARFFPASHLVAHHYIEAQSDSDLKEAVVDEEAEKKKKQYAALQSIGLFGEMEDGFTYDSGF